MKQRLIAAAIAAFACVANHSSICEAAELTRIIIDVGDHIEIFDDVGDPQKFGRIPSIVRFVGPLGYPSGAMIGDIFAINDKPAKGTMVGTIMAFGGRPEVRPGFAISDITRNTFRNLIFELLNADGSLIGSISVMGLAAGQPAPGGLGGATSSAYAVVGGTGAFMGARGQGVEGGALSRPQRVGRVVSMTEDPAYRRINGGGIRRYNLDIISEYVPKIVQLAAGPAVTHASSGRLVTASEAAVRGEYLSLFVSGLGPTSPSREPGKGFDAEPKAVVTSPVEVTIGGKPCALAAAVGYPGATDGYQINIQVPSDVPSGTQDLTITAAWISGLPVPIAIR